MLQNGIYFLTMKLFNRGSSHERIISRSTQRNHHKCIVGRKHWADVQHLLIESTLIPYLLLSFKFCKTYLHIDFQTQHTCRQWSDDRSNGLRIYCVKIITSILNMFAAATERGSVRMVTVEIAVVLSSSSLLIVVKISLKQICS